eukprot:5473291-Prymnesium_polylepis.1
MAFTEGKASMLALRAAGATCDTTKISTRFDKDNPPQFCDKTDTTFHGWLSVIEHAPADLDSDGTGPSTQDKLPHSALVHANESLKLQRSMAVGIHESDAGMMAWPQQ